MEQRPSEECEDCFWRHENTLLCHGCPNNPETEESRKNHPEECEDCLWWHENTLLCHGCPNNPETEESRKNHLDEISGLSRKKIVLADA